MQRWRVPFGFLFAAAFVVFARPTALSLGIGAIVAVVGLLIRAWASGHIRKNAELAISGPYAHTRNPLYFGSFLLGLGFSVAAANVWLGLAFAVFYLGIYLPVMRVESRDVGELFPAEFKNYAANVPLFVPRILAWNAGETVKFDFALYLRYREYRAAIGLAAALGLLCVKAAFFS